MPLSPKRWADEEILFQDMGHIDGTVEERSEWRKGKQFCERTVRDRCSFLHQQGKQRSAVRNGQFGPEMVSKCGYPAMRILMLFLKRTPTEFLIYVVAVKSGNGFYELLVRG